MSFIIGSKCIGEKDGACIDACPIDDCIVEVKDQMLINPDLCIECGACIPACPVDAIYMDEEEAIEEEGVEIVSKNYEHFGFRYDS